MLEKAGPVAIVLIFCALIAPAASPVQISYVTSDSMEPTIGTDDGYILVPAGAVTPGEIITYYSDARDGYVTHRVVGTTTKGYVTQGDNNPSTDQTTGTPPVRRDSISGQVLSISGSVVAIPQLGALIEFLQNNWTLALTFAGVVIVLQMLASRNPTPVTTGRQSILHSRNIVIPVVLMAILASVIFISSGVAHTKSSYSVTKAGGEASGVLAVGENTTETLQSSITDTKLTQTLYQTKGMRPINTSGTSMTQAANITAASATDSQSGISDIVRPQLTRPSSITLKAEIPAQDQIGSHTTEVSVYRYPATLPTEVLAQLQSVHPSLAALGSVLMAVVPVYLVYWLLVDPLEPIRSSRRHWFHRLGGG